MTRRVWTITAIACLLIAPLSAPHARELYTRPSTPSREALDQLNLTIEWKINVPMESKRDDFQSIRFPDGQVLIQTRSGGIFLHDAVDGSTIWRRVIDPTYHVSCSPGYNNQYVFVVRGTKLHALDRKSGNTLWTYNLPNVPIVPPVADDKQLYFFVGADRVHAYRLPHALDLEPRFEKRYVVDPRTGVNRLVDARVAVGPTDYFETRLHATIGHAPIYVGDVIAIASDNGKLFLLSPHSPKLLKDFESKKELSAPLNWHGNSLYWGTTDNALTCIDLQSATIEWTHATGGAILKRPETTEQDIYIIADRVGLSRLDRKTVKERWIYRDATHYLASNKEFVYALNGRGELLVLSRDRGTRLGTMDACKFTHLVSNDRTDRVFLAASDGLIVCMRDKNYPKPMIHKRDPVFVLPDPTKKKFD